MLDKRFTYEPPSEELQSTYVEIERAARILAQVISTHSNPADPCTEESLKKLEEVVHWARRAAQNKKT